MSKRKFQYDSPTGRGSDLCSAMLLLATVYGSINVLQVEALRNYRDNVLMQNFVGRTFVDIYYSDTGISAGKSVVNFISTKARFAIPTIKKSLDTIVEGNS